MPFISRTAFRPSSGKILLSVEGNDEFVILDVEPDKDWIAGSFNGDTHYVSDGAAVSRPVTGLPSAHSLASGVDWSVPDVPEGTLVLIDGVEVGTVDATGLVLSFSLAGLWRVTLKPPFPWIEASCEVTVT
ncbi:hypothetical protein [Acidiphilium sp.]|uniref:hypothetical protein n=1 Tax=Acidiphilium sp. TaxID=527 RepID=UPI00258CB0DE|nr:hypothetical protein [Acidiphilium sp.]